MTNSLLLIILLAILVLLLVHTITSHNTMVHLISRMREDLLSSQPPHKPSSPEPPPLPTPEEKKERMALLQDLINNKRLFRPQRAARRPSSGLPSGVRMEVDISELPGQQNDSSDTLMELSSSVSAS